MSDSDSDLLGAVARGDKSALQELFQRHNAGLTAFLATRLRNPVEAADVLQETFLAVWRQADRYQGRASAKTWIYSIARNKAVDSQRRSGREAQLDEDYDVPDDGPDAQTVIEAASDAALVRACIAGLSDAHARVVKLVFYEELGYGEVSQVEGVPLGTIKTRIYHAKKLLMACLAITFGRG